MPARLPPRERSSVSSSRLRKIGVAAGFPFLGLGASSPKGAGAVKFS